MTKRIATFLCVVAIVLMIGMLFGACGAKPEPEPSGNETVIGTEPAEVMDTVPTVPTVPTESGSTVPTQENENTAPSVEVGVGERGDYSDDTTPVETKPVETKPVETQPAETQPGTVEIPNAFDPENTTMEMWDAMTLQEQKEFKDSFPTLLDFVHWYNNANSNEPTYETIPAGDNKVDLGELIKP